MRRGASEPYQTTFVIPNLNKEEKRVPISSVVLSSQRVDMKDAIYDAAKAKERAKDDAVNPLVQDGKKLVPSVTRVFSQNRDIYVYLQAYNRHLPAACGQLNGELPPQPDEHGPLMAFVTLYFNGTEAFKTQPIAVAPNAATRLGITPLNFDVSAAGLKPGQYECQVTVLDPATEQGQLLASPDRHRPVSPCPDPQFGRARVTKVAAVSFVTRTVGIRERDNGDAPRTLPRSSRLKKAFHPPPFAPIPRNAPVTSCRPYFCF